MEARDPGIHASPDPNLTQWWTVLNDPVLTSLVEDAYRQNPTLRLAGARVLQAQAQRGIAIGQLFPQVQDAIGSFAGNKISKNAANQQFGQHTFNSLAVGFDAAWELDVWGKFRRGIESADAALLASVASYDDVLVSLIAEVAATYTQLRVLETRLAIVDSNIDVQRQSYRIAEDRFNFGAVTELDVAQALSLLRDTEALRPPIEAGIQQSKNNLCVLLGLPPQDIDHLLGTHSEIPLPPKEVAVGVPAELLRRRPDIRQAERELAAQSAQIGIAESDLYPAFSLVGQIQFQAEDVKNLFEGNSLQGFGGPSFRWAILNYGRIRNNVRVQDASYQALVENYEAVVLNAQGEVENSLIGYLRDQVRVDLLVDAASAADKAVTIADLQYREGAVDYVRVLQAQQVKLQEEDSLVTSRGQVIFDLIAAYKALGGGWEIRFGNDFLPRDTLHEMEERTNWGDLLQPAEAQEDVDQADTDFQSGDSPWKWRWWWPQW